MTLPVLGWCLLGLAGGVAATLIFIRGRERRRAALLAALHSEAARLRVLFEAAPEGIMTFDRDGMIRNANPAAHRLFGYRMGWLIGTPGSATLIEQDRPRARATMLDPENIAKGGFETEYTGLRATGATFPMQVSMTYAPPGEDWFAQVFVRDISRQRDAERVKDEFVSTVSHELRTPLTSIAGSLGLIAGGAAGALPEKAARLVSIAQSNSQRLVKLINDVLDMEKLTSGSLPFHMVEASLKDVADRAIDMTRGYADQLGVELALESGASDLAVRGDADRLIQVVVNLLSNAAKYSPRRGTVRVRVDGDGAGARLSVADSGPGVPEAFRDRIFSRFAQADTSDARGQSGTGLGLYIAREIAERHGGRLWFESPPGGGAVFHLELPTLSPAPIQRTASDRILLVEDAPAAAALLEAILEEDGLKVDHAGTLEKARDLLRQHGRFGAMVLDLRLPDGDGVDLVKEVRADPAKASMPILVVSADAGRGSDPEVRMLGVADWMEKPVNPERLVGLVRAALAQVETPPRLILHVDDDRDIREVVATALAGWGEVAPAESIVQARAILAGRRPDLVLLDPELRDGDGGVLLAELASLADPPPVIVFCAQDSVRDYGPGVAAVLIKSRTPLTGLVNTALGLLKLREEAP